MATAWATATGGPQATPPDAGEGVVSKLTTSTGVRFDSRIGLSKAFLEADSFQ